MKKFKVVFKIFWERYPSFREIIVEAGTKKSASIRAMIELNKDTRISGLYKTIESIEEV